MKNRQESTGITKKITIKRIPEGVSPENTRLFYTVLNQFNHKTKKYYKREDIISNIEAFKEFQDFFIQLTLEGKIQAEGEQIQKVMNEIEKLREQVGDTLREVDKFYDEIYQIIYAPNRISKNDESFKRAMLSFRSAYSIMKQKFHGIERESKDESGQNERYFNHIQEVMRICLEEIPNPNLEKLLIALLHDSIEDISNFDYEVIKALYGKYVAEGVEHLSKKEWKRFLSEEESRILKNLDTDSEKYQNIVSMAKQRRNKEYFENMESIEQDDYLDVKFADRIHNLRTLDECDNEKIRRKIEETRKYFLKPAWERNPTAYYKILEEIERLKNTIKNSEN